jgi:hypothetical protein
VLVLSRRWVFKIILAKYVQAEVEENLLELLASDARLGSEIINVYGMLLRLLDPGDIAAGAGEAFNEARLDGISPATHRNDRNRLGRILGRPDSRVRSCYDDISFETHQLGGKLREPIQFPLRISVLDGDVLFFYVATLAQSEPNSLGTSGLNSCIAHR